MKFLGVDEVLEMEGLLTTMCWKSQDFMTWVACLGNTPRLFFFFPDESSSSKNTIAFWERLAVEVGGWGVAK